jgi:hypothetical protein
LNVLRLIGAGGAQLTAIVLAFSAAPVSCADDVFVHDGRDVTTLSNEERGVFCDQLAGIAGGYGAEARKHLTCDDGAIRTIQFVRDSNRAECEYRYLNLPTECWDLTVGQIKKCIREFYAQTCTSLMDATPLASCDAIPDCWE